MVQRWRPLDTATTRRLRDVPFTYPEVAATAGELPAGYHHLSDSVQIGSGAASFMAARDAVLTWQVQLRSGVAISASEPTVIGGGVAVLSLGVGPARIHAPVRVVDVVDEGQRAGFAYGTLPGHPESGEELFVVEIRDDGSVTFTVTAFSRPHSRLARMGGPLGRLAQTLITKRYLRALG
ncbi:DUF1990 family protein [Gordonia sp. DT101]|uniref:DUF1990 family protein n=1 Tax=Gordonia sp. DT101 TaxID=3416545 RepID=UPI003CF67181